MTNANDVSPAFLHYLKMPLAGEGQRVGLFGGSFNPPHDGHVHVSEQALRRLNLDWVWWLVTPGNPLKDQSQLAPLETRLRACENITPDPRMKITGFEALRPSRYTVDALNYIVTRNPHLSFVWIMGADNLAQFHRWDRWREIAAMMPIAVIDRPGSTLSHHSAFAAKALSDFRIDENDSALLISQPAPAWTFLHGPRSSLSSTVLRAKRHAALNQHSG